jgi:hypothetical protein
VIYYSLKIIQQLLNLVRILLGRNIFYKDNIIEQFPDLPRGDREQIWKLFKGQEND